MKATHEFIKDLADKISMPEIYYLIRELIEDPRAKIDDYEKAIQTDSMLAVRIIRIANSGFFGFNRKVDDLYEAICLIGLIQLHDLLLSSLCMRAFYAIPEQILNSGSFWRHSVKCGIASKSLARLCRIPANNRFFTLGLLVEIGHAAMYIKAPELALTAIQESWSQGKPIEHVERGYFGFDYCQLGATLMRHWRLPEVYPQIIGCHLSPGHSRPDFRNAAEVVGFAHRYCENLNEDSTNPNSTAVNHQLFSHLPENFEAILGDEISRNLDEVYEMLSPPNAVKPAMSTQASRP